MTEPAPTGQPLRITLQAAQRRMQAQGHTGPGAYRRVAFRCPMCRTLQSMASLAAAGVPEADLEQVIGFSCEGRFTGAGPWPGDAEQSPVSWTRRTVRGCDWSLGGLFRLHTLEILYPDGAVRPCFAIATAAEAAELDAQLAAAPRDVRPAGRAA